VTSAADIEITISYESSVEEMIADAIHIEPKIIEVMAE